MHVCTQYASIIVKVIVSLLTLIHTVVSYVIKLNELALKCHTLSQFFVINYKVSGVLHNYMHYTYVTKWYFL